MTPNELATIFHEASNLRKRKEVPAGKCTQRRDLYVMTELEALEAQGLAALGMRNPPYAGAISSVCSEVLWLTFLPRLVEVAATREKLEELIAYGLGFDEHRQLFFLPEVPLWGA